MELDFHHAVGFFGFTHRFLTKGFQAGRLFEGDAFPLVIGRDKRIAVVGCLGGTQGTAGLAQALVCGSHVEGQTVISRHGFDPVVGVSVRGRGKGCEVGTVLDAVRDLWVVHFFAQVVEHLLLRDGGGVSCGLEHLRHLGSVQLRNDRGTVLGKGGWITFFRRVQRLPLRE